MNVYQKVGLAFFVGVVASLLLRDDLVLLAVAAFVILLMMFAKTWLAVFTVIQWIGSGISKVGHSVIGLLGDLIVRGSRWVKARLRQSTVPPKDEMLEESTTHGEPVDTSAEDQHDRSDELDAEDQPDQPDQPDELDIPDFMKETVPSTNNVGLEIFEPADS